MKLKKVNPKINAIGIVLGILSTFIAIICLVIRVPVAVSGQEKEFNMLAASFILPSGDKKLDEQTLNRSQFEYDDLTKKNDCTYSKEKVNLEKSTPNTNTSSKEEIKEDNSTQLGRKHKVIETNISAGGEPCENFYIKNSTGRQFNFKEILKSKPDITIKKHSSPQVLILHTHTSECYMEKDEGFYCEGYYPRSEEYNKNVTRVGKAIADSLEAEGISTVHDITYHDNPSYNGSYSRSAQTVKNNLKKYPSIKVVLDIHRDGMETKEKNKLKPTFKYKGKKGCQIMIMTGCDTDGSLGFPDWKQNLKLGIRLQKKAETMYPGMTRPMYLGHVRYNMHLTHGSLLIEVGSEANTLQEACYTGSLLGRALASTLSELK